MQPAKLVVLEESLEALDASTQSEVLASIEHRALALVLIAHP